ncbi:MAG: metal ABC transporter solute-binding protein, Zn/Mn family [Pseudonocardiaceae bacterium]
MIKIRRRRSLVAASSVAACTLMLSGCGADEAARDDGRISVVASTNVWGSVVSAIGDDLVSVESIIVGPTGDPHSYESTAADGLTVAEAQMMIYNGGGYDDFAERLAEQVGEATVIDVFALSGHGEERHAEERHAEEEDGHAHELGANEHVWYDLATVGKVADEVATRLAEIQPEDAETFTDNATAFKAELDSLAERLAEIGSANPNATVLATEPVAHYLLDGAKLTDATPEAFSRAIEGETDVPVAAQDEVNRIIDAKRVAAVINNPQTQTPVTEQVLDKAEESGVPVVDITETLPEGMSDYLKWVGGQVEALAGAVGR